MQLLQRKKRTPGPGDWEARLFALQAMQDADTKVATSARSIVVSDAPAYIRIQAAGLWAKEQPRQALPHIKVFLHSAESRFLSVVFLAESASKESVVEFKRIISNAQKEDAITVFEAHRGLLRAGDKTHLADIRKWVQKPARTKEDETNKIEGIYLLGELGLEEDKSRLEKMFDSNLKVIAAATLLEMFARKKK